MEIKLNKKEILCLIENIGDVAIALGNRYIDVEVKNQKYNKFLTELDIPDAKWIAEKYIRSVATTFDYKNDLKYTFKFDEITISSKILYENESWYSHKIGLNENEIDMFIDNRFEEAKSINNCDDNYDYDNCDDYDNNYDDDNCNNDSDDDPDEINYKIQAEMEQYMFENGKDYEDYQEPQLYDTEDNLIDSLNNDLDSLLN